MQNQIKNMLIGLFVVVACFLIAGLILFIQPGVGNGKQVIKVHFTNINGINVGTRVLLAGRQIGEVYSIDQIPQAREQIQNEFGNVYFYLVTLHIDSSVTLFTSDKVIISTSGLLGEKQIDVIPQPLVKASKHLVVTENSQIYADSGDFLESAFNTLSELSNKVEDTLDRIISWVDQYGHDLGSAIQAFGRASSEIAKIAKSCNELEIPKEIHETLNSVNSSISYVNEMLEEMHEGNFAKNLTLTISNMSELTDSIAHSKGTVGRLINEDGIYIQATATLSKINHLMDDVNNYGLLFWHNKRWLRSREERLAAYQQLNSPEAFRYYITQESESINQSLSRLNEIAKRAEETKNQESLTQNPNLWKNLNNLKQKLDELQINVSYYIEELNNKTQQTKDQ
jgi:phospholipid/cholesterol/gamma-HCH transport system substrate-binding protein